MANTGTTTSDGELILVGPNTGYPMIPAPTPLTRLNYFDGKFLRADDLRLEQEGMRALVHHSNQAGGWGIVYGFSCTRYGDVLSIDPGLAIDRQGRVLHLPHATSVKVSELIDLARGRSTDDGSAADGEGSFEECELASEDPGVEPQAGVGDLWIITLSHAEAYCGNEDVYGNLCDEACTTTTDRPRILEGVVARAEPWGRKTPLIDYPGLGAGHQRSLLATAYFADEDTRRAHLISATGLQSIRWCLGAEPQGDGPPTGVPIALVQFKNGAVTFHDAWIARRERMEAPPRHDWTRSMRFRPWRDYLAQILQFQCQLRDAPGSGGVTPGDDDPCEDLRGSAEQALRLVQAIRAAPEEERRFLGKIEDPIGLEALERELTDAAVGSAGKAVTLLARGFVTLPSAGYLAVDPESSASINDQVRRQMGEGIDLRFCAVREDFVPHAVEEAQHMERISLVQGLADPDAKPRVDVLVPEGVVERREIEVTGRGYVMSLELARKTLPFVFVGMQGSKDGGKTSTGQLARGLVAGTQFSERQVFFGAARGDATSSGGLQFHYAGLLDPRPDKSGKSSKDPGVRVRSFEEAVRGDREEALLTDLVAEKSVVRRSEGIWVTMQVDKDPFRMGAGEVATTTFEVAFGIQRIVVGNSAMGGVVLTFAGDLLRDTNQSGIVGDAVQTRLTGDLTGRIVADGGANEQVLPRRSVQERVVVRRDASGKTAIDVEPLLFLTQLGTRLDLYLGRLWTSADRARVEARLRGSRKGEGKKSLKDDRGDTSMTLFAADQQIDPTVAEANHQAHVASLAALESIGRALGEPDFARVPSLKLFPPPTEALGELVVRGTRDWVLFHRRRHKDCGVVAETRPVASSVYRVLHVRVTPGSDLEILRGALESDDGGALSAFDVRSIADVEFAPGIASLTSPAGDLTAEWELRIPEDAEVVFAAIATRSESPDDVDLLAQTRLNAVSEVLGTVVDRRAGRDEEVLPVLPTALPSGEKTGVIVVATEEVGTQCHDVWRMEGDGARVKALQVAIGGAGAAGLEAVFEEFGLQRVDRVQFRNGSADVHEASDGSLLAEWNDAGDGVPFQGLVLFQDPNAAAGLPAAEVARAQAAHVASRIHSDAAAPVPLSPMTAAFAPPGCPVITVLVSPPPVATACNEVFFMHRRWKTSDEDEERIVTALGEQGASFEEIFKTFRLAQLGEAVFGANDNTPDSDSLVRVATNMDIELSQIGGGLSLAVIRESPRIGYRVVSVHASATPQGRRLAETTQAKMIRDALEPTESPAVRDVTWGGGDLPTHCGSVTVILLDRILGSPDIAVIEVTGNEVASEDEVLDFRFRPEGELERKKALEIAKKLQEGNDRVRRIVVAGPEEPSGEDIEIRRDVLRDFLVARGLADADIEVETRVYTDAERRILEARGAADKPAILLLKQ